MKEKRVKTQYCAWKNVEKALFWCGGYLVKRGRRKYIRRKETKTENNAAFF